MNATIYMPEKVGDFCIVAEPEQYLCAFRCYQCVALCEGLPQYNVAGYVCGMDMTDDIEKAQVYLSGEVKWDGCANLQFDEQDNVMLHFCGVEDVRKIGALLERLYEIAAKAIPFWSDR